MENLSRFSQSFKQAPQTKICNIRFDREVCMDKIKKALFPGG
jgi:hypothetical protein